MVEIQHHGRDIGKAIPRLIIAIGLVFAVLLVTIQGASAESNPNTTIVSVQKGVSVTISGVNFPQDQTFTVRMGVYGTLGIGGVVVGTKEPSSSTSFTATYTIPASLVGASKIAIRFDSAQGYYAFDWFENSDVASTPGPTPTAPAVVNNPVPTFTITNVQQGAAVTISTSHFPANQIFTVRIGEYGTLGIGGTEAGPFDSAAGGSLTQTFSIPAALADRAKLAIRLDSPLGYYSYNWFYNVSSSTSETTAATATPAVTATPGASPTAGATPTPVATSVPAYNGIPSFSIVSVVKDASVTISGVNFPPNQTFTVRMGEFGTLGIGGMVITTYDSGAGGSFTATYPIPSALALGTKIAIRLDSAAGYYYAFNWFYNN